MYYRNHHGEHHESEQKQKQIWCSPMQSYCPFMYSCSLMYWQKAMQNSDSDPTPDPPIGGRPGFHQGFHPQGPSHPLHPYFHGPRPNFYPYYYPYFYPYFYPYLTPYDYDDYDDYDN